METAELRRHQEVYGILYLVKVLELAFHMVLNG